MIKEYTDKIKKGSTVAIYGAAQNGLEIKQYLEQNRPDVKILCFFDTFKEGSLDGLEIKKLKELPQYKSKFDVLLVSIRRVNAELDLIFERYNIPYILKNRKKFLIF